MAHRDRGRRSCGMQLLELMLDPLALLLVGMLLLMLIFSGISAGIYPVDGQSAHAANGAGWARARAHDTRAHVHG